VSRNLMSNHATPITSILSASPNYGTSAVEAGFLVFCHTDVEHDIRQLPDFKHVSEYGTRKVIHPMELGSQGRFRFIVSPELAPYLSAGAAVAGTSLYSAASDNADVYPCIVVGEYAWGDVALRGKESIDPTWIPPGQKDTNDPLGQRGYIGGKFYAAAVALNNGWFAVVEVGVTALS
jgi:N4-gp56 family major capsid protein